MPIPIPLQIPGHEADEFVIAKDQDEYIPLPAVAVTFSGGGSGVVTRWRLSDAERAMVAAGADLWVQHLTFGGPLQPLMPRFDCPVEIGHEPS